MDLDRKKMNKLNNTSTFNKLILLIAIFLIGFVSLFVLNQFFTQIINKLDKQTENLHAKISIGEVIAHDITQIRSLFNELSTTTSSQKSRELVKEKIKKKIEAINTALVVLEQGGTYTKNISLNIAEYVETTKTIIYKKKENSFSLEAIDIKPKLLELEHMLDVVDAMLQKRTYFKNKKDLENYVKISHDIYFYYKSLPSFFDRMIENIRRLLYESEDKLNNLRELVESDKKYYLQVKLILILSIIAIVLILGTLVSKRVNENSKKLEENVLKLENKEKAIRTILDSQPNIIIVKDSQDVLNVNKKFFDFFTQYRSVEEFKLEHKCICEFFEEDIPNEDYIYNRDYDGLEWYEYLLANNNKNFKVIMKKDGVSYHYSLQITLTLFDNKSDDIAFILTLNDITAEIDAQKELKHLNDNLEHMVENKTKELQDLNDNLEERIKIEAQKVREKDNQMLQQARFAALGEMIGNIAHQWRQPLSAINGTASGAKIQIELGLISNEEIAQSYDEIIGFVEFLNNTIEDFRGFFRKDKEIKKFNLIETLNKTISMTRASYKDHGITLSFPYKNLNLEAQGYPNELAQVFLNILNNAKDAIINNKVKNGLVVINTEENEHNHIVYIMDNAGGVPKAIMKKIFDPYFTTKHQSQGTGIGLYMSKNIVEKHHNGFLDIENKEFSHNEATFFGACFQIIIPKNNKELKQT